LPRVKSLHDAMLGHERLQENTPRPFCPARPSRHLLKKLVGPLARTQIAIFEPEIGIHHANQREPGKMMPLRHDLRADDNIDFPRLDGCENGLMGGWPPQIVARNNGGARLREKLRHLLRYPLHPRTAGNQRFFRPAGRAALGHRGGVATMMAGKLAAETMLDEPCRTLRTFDAVAAGPAKGERRIAPPIEEEHGLLPRLQCAQNLPREDRRKPTPAFRRMGAHINGADSRQHRLAMPRRKLKGRV